MEAIKKEEIELLKKINTLRKEVKDTLTKSGKNDFSHFTYFQLKDFIPTVVDKCAEKQELFIDFYIDKEKVDLPSKTTITTNGESTSNITEENFEYREYAYLTIIDLSSGISKVYKKETKEALVKGASDIQNLGAKSTYMKRYLYMDLLEIAEDDTVDTNDKTNNNSSPAQVSTPPTPKVETKNTETKKTATTEAAKPVETTPAGNELMSLADKEEITKFIIENKLEAKVIVDIAKELGYASPVELRAKDKEAVITAIKEKVGK